MDLTVVHTYPFFPPLRDFIDELRKRGFNVDHFYFDLWHRVGLRRLIRLEPKFVFTISSVRALPCIDPLVHAKGGKIINYLSSCETFHQVIKHISINSYAYLNSFLSLLYAASLLPNSYLATVYASKILLSSNLHMNFFPDYNFFKKKVEVLPLGLDLSRKYNPKLIDKPGKEWLDIIAKFDKFLLFYGTLSYEREVDVLLRVFSKLLRHFPKLGLIILDRGSLYFDRRIINLRKSYLNPNIVVVNKFLSRNILLPIILSADIVVLPFKHLTGIFQPPLTLLEAMALGKTVVTTKLEVIDEIVQNGVNGILVEPDSDESFHSALLKILSSNEKLLEELGQNARETMLRQYNLKDFANNFVRIMESIA